MGQQVQERSAVIKKPGVILGQLKKESVMLDKDGNEIDKRTKRVIKLNEQN